MICAVPGQECSENCIHPNGCHGFEKLSSKGGEGMKTDVKILSHEVQEIRDRRAAQKKEIQERIESMIKQQPAPPPPFGKRLVDITVSIIGLLLCITLIVATGLICYHLIAWLMPW